MGVIASAASGGAIPAHTRAFPIMGRTMVLMGYGHIGEAETAIDSASRRAMDVIENEAFGTAILAHGPASLIMGRDLDRCFHTVGNSAAYWMAFGTR